jgi:hypothetical protein
MKRLVMIGLFCVSALTVVAQSELPIQNGEKFIGKNLKTNKDILAKELLFPERIDHYQLDTTSGFLTVQLRGTSKNGKWLNSTGTIVLYDLFSKKVKWTKKINYGQSSLKQFGPIIIQTINGKSFCLNNDNGEAEWEVKNLISYVERDRKLGIGYLSNTFSGNTNSLEGIDLSNGNSRWKRLINREYGWNDIFHLNDSVLIVAAAGLHSINLRDGTGWDYNTITGAKDYKSTIAANAAGAVLGALTGTFVMSTGSDLVSDIVSNVLVDSSMIYFASREKISRLDHNGIVNWSFPLSKDQASKSSIFIRDTLLFMVNKGFAYMGNRQVNIGAPFMAAFNKNSGKQLFLTELDDMKDQINGFKTDKDTLILILNDRILKYSMINGSVILKKSFDVQITGELNYFVGDQAYLKNDNSFIPLLLSDSTCNYLYTKTGKILVVNDWLNITKQIDFNQLYIRFLQSGDYRFLAKGEETTVIDAGNQPITVLKLTGKALVAGSKLYDIQEKSFVEIDLKGFEGE